MNDPEECYAARFSSHGSERKLLVVAIITMCVSAKANQRLRGAV